MAKLSLPADQWTLVPDPGADYLVEARYHGVYLSTDGSQPADKTEGYSLSDGSAIVLTAGTVAYAQPIRNGEASDIYVHPV